MELQYRLEIHQWKNGSCMASYIKIEEWRAKRQTWRLNIFRVQEEGEEEPVEGMQKVIRMVEILTSIKYEPVYLAGIRTSSFMII